MRWKVAAIFLLIFLCSSLVLASVSIDSLENVGSGESVLVTGSCDDSPVLLQAVIGLSTVWLNEVETDSNNLFSTTFTPAEDGTYTIYAACDSESFNDEVCVGSDCGGLSNSDDSDDSEDTSESGSSSSSSSSSSGGGGGGGGRCSEEWECDDWTYCNNELEQSRDCYQTSSCRTEDDKPNVTQACDACEESWICESWSDCDTNGDTQIRTCYDEHSCGTYQLRPDETRVCEDESGWLSWLSSSSSSSSGGGSVTEYEYVYLESDSFSAKLINKILAFLSEYWLMLVLGVVSLGILILIIYFVIHIKHKHAPAENNDELENYVKEEMKGGMRKEDIEKNLEHSGWSEKEVERVLEKIPNSNSHIGSSLPPIQG